MTLTRSKLEQLAAELIDRSMAPRQAGAGRCRLSVSDNEVLLVGNQHVCLMQCVEEFFKKVLTKHPDEVVASCYQAGVWEPSE